jgi:aminoglycoside phosphotransferase (APT) family kinase protein
MNNRLRDIGTAAVDYLGRRWSCSCELDHIEQIPGGASRETYLIRLLKDDTPMGVVLRRDPPSSLIDTERALEYQTYAAVFDHGVMPVPRPIVLEEDNPGALARPFSIMAQITEGQASPAGLDEAHMHTHRHKLGECKWSMLGALAATSVDELGVGRFMTTPAHPAAHEFAYWRDVIRTDALHPQPIAEAAIRWLERNLPPPSTRTCLVHGDYRTGNFLYTDDGRITAVLDWEMAHIGDPLEDLAWSLDPLWSPEPTLAGRLLTRAHAIEIWEASSGMPVDREAFRWWQVFASIKAIAIWISSAEDYVNGTTKEPILALAGWPMIDRQNRILLDRLSPDSTYEYAEPLA